MHREGNKAADWLAKTCASTVSDLVTINTPSVYVTRLLNDDIGPHNVRAVWNKALWCPLYL